MYKMLRTHLAIIVLPLAHTVFGGSFSLPVSKKTIPSGNHHVLQANRGTGAAFEFAYEGFWFGNFTVGATAELELLIDTGSSDVVLNPGVYQPSPASRNLHKTFNTTYATTNSNGSGTETLFGSIFQDLVGLDGTGLSVAEQALGSTTQPSTPPSFPLNGLIGFAGSIGDVFNSTPWFHSLCDQCSLDECRFGLAFETDGTGEQYLGKVERDRLERPLSVTSLTYVSSYEAYFEWATFGDIAANGKAVSRDALIQFDSGTTVIFGLVDDVKTMFDAAGVQWVITPNTTADTYPLLTGYYPCDNPPQLGLGFPSITNATTAKQDHNSTISHHSKIYEMLPEALAFNKTGNNCTASIFGSDQFGSWLVGQAFFQGRYIDHNVAENTMGFANLKHSCPSF